jgi:hypothetical protein
MAFGPEGWKCAARISASSYPTRSAIIVPTLPNTADRSDAGSWEMYWCPTASPEGFHDGGLSPAGESSCGTADRRGGGSRPRKRRIRYPISWCCDHRPLALFTILAGRSRQGRSSAGSSTLTAAHAASPTRPERASMRAFVMKQVRK